MSTMTVKIVSKATMMTGMVLLLGLLQTAVAEDRLQLDETNIQGASELPKVLYKTP